MSNGGPGGQPPTRIWAGESWASIGPTSADRRVIIPPLRVQLRSGLFVWPVAVASVTLHLLSTNSEETSMRRQRAPYAKRTAWNAIVILAVVIVVGGGIAAYEISHLQTEVNNVQSDLSALRGQYTTLYYMVVKLSAMIK